MTQYRPFQKLLVGLAAGSYLLTAGLVGTVLADDADIYVSKFPTGGSANILFVLDTSGSMRNETSGSTQSRMDAVKEALVDLLNREGNFRMGLATYHSEYGGAINFPVTDLNAGASGTDQLAVAVVGANSDDAEENTTTGVVTLGNETPSSPDTTLEMTQVPLTGGVGGTAMVWTSNPAIHASADDDEPEFSITSSDLDIGRTELGIRFREVDIPQNAVILHAEVQFVTDDYNSSTTQTVIRGHDTDDAPDFNSQNVDSRSTTSASVDWSNIRTTNVGEDISTPNIRGIIQEIVTRSGWSAMNDIAILFSETGSNRREYRSYDHSTVSDRPKLVVTYAIPGTTGISQRIVDGDNDAEQNLGGSLNVTSGDLDMVYTSSAQQKVGLRFENVNIPSNAEILYADIDLTVDDELTGQADFRIRAQEAPDAPHFDTSNGGVDILSRTDLTDSANAVIWSDVRAPDDNEILQTPDLSALITEVIADSTSPAWDPASGNNNLVFIFEENGSGSDRDLCTEEGCDADAATLNVFYTLPVTTAPEEQVVGLRFNDLAIPQGAQILEAAIEFRVGETTTEDSALTIAIESADNAAPYQNSSNNISGRVYSGTVNWNPGPWDTVGAAETTVNADDTAVDVGSLLQSVVNRNGWCGGNAVAFKIGTQNTLTARRIAKSFESAAADAPVLRAKYTFDPVLASTGCVKRTFASTITTGNNDAEENSSGSILLNDSDLDLDPNNLVGLRFENIQIPQGANIVDTRITLTSEDDDDDGSATIVFTAQQDPNPGVFSTGTNDISDRVSPGDPSVTWSFSNTWDLGDVNTTGVDLSSTIQPVINDSGWEPGNALLFVLDMTSGERDATPVNASGDRRPARLEIEWQANLVNSSLPPLSQRDQMIRTVNELQGAGYTPTVDTMFEGASYMLGQPVHYGKTRGAGSVYTPDLENDETGSGETGPIDSDISSDTDDELLEDNADYSILSHSDSFTPSIAPTREGACTELNPTSEACFNERIVGSPNYVSPLLSGGECEKGYMIVLSDGIANRNSSSSLIDSLIGSASCTLPITTIDSNGEPVMSGSSFVTRPPSNDETCAVDLAKYMYDTDFVTDSDPNNPVFNNVKTYTIGFDLPLDSDENRDAVEFLKEIAAQGNGGEYGAGFYPAQNASELALVFDAILTDIVDETSSLTAPGLSINAFNRLFNRNDVYFSSFKPSETTGWFGNLKKFKLCVDENGCTFGEVIDKDGDPAVFTDETNPATFGQVREDAKGFWSADADVASEVLDGGAGEQIPTWTERRAYVYAAASAPGTPDYSNPKTAGTALEQIDPNDTNASFNSNLKTRLFQSGICGGSASSSPTSGDNDCLNDMIEWLLGKKFDNDPPRDGNESDVDRWAFGDPMHGRPLVLTLGSVANDDPDTDPTDDEPISKIILGTNDGGLRMINEYNGKEEWIFYPQAMLGMQDELKNNDVGTHQYGMDGTTTGRVYDCVVDGIVDPNQSTDCNGDGTADSEDKEFVHVYTGMRRGGRNLYAINVTPDTKLDTSSERDALNKVTPELLWRIDGGSGDYAQLGQTWSNAIPTRIAGPNGAQIALIMAGGYDPAQDGGTYRNAATGDSQGNAIYIIDADTGQRLFWASDDGTGADLELDGMNTAIPATVTLIDKNGDGLSDTIYFVDLRAQVWRIDLSVASGAISGKGGRLAVLGSDSADTDKRKFFYAAAVAQVNDEQFSGGKYNLIGIISGDRSEPNGTAVMERVYAIRDYLAEGDIASGGSNYPKCNPLNSGSCSEGTALDHDTLFDVTEATDFVLVDEDTGNVSGPVNTLKESHGWYFELEGTGEKGFSAATVLGGKMFFTTYLPATEATINSDDSCSAQAALGSSRFYAVDFFTGAPAFEFFDGSEGYSKLDRYVNLGAGPSADVVPAYFGPGTTLVVPTGSGAVAQDPDLQDRIFKSYWNEPR